MDVGFDFAQNHMADPSTRGALALTPAFKCAHPLAPVHRVQYHARRLRGTLHFSFVQWFNDNACIPTQDRSISVCEKRFHSLMHFTLGGAAVISMQAKAHNPTCGSSFPCKVVALVIFPACLGYFLWLFGSSLIK